MVLLGHSKAASSSQRDAGRCTGLAQRIPHLFELCQCLVIPCRPQRRAYIGKSVAHCRQGIDKLLGRLGRPAAMLRHHLPQGIPFALGVEMEFLRSLSAVPKLRTLTDGAIYLTDNGNYILDTSFGEINGVRDLVTGLDSRAGIAGHGIFRDLADMVIIASEVGITEIRKGEKEKFLSLLKVIKVMQSD